MRKKDWREYQAYKATGLSPEEIEVLKAFRDKAIQKQDEPKKTVLKVETNIFDKEEIIEGCTVQVLTNTHTGQVSIGWWKGTAADMPGAGGAR